MDRHENGPEHYCEICKEHFPNEPVLKAHINKLHYKLGQFDCDICKETIEDDALAMHMKTHTNVKTHVCEVCKSYFMQKSQYNVHMRMHTGERPYQCRVSSMLTKLGSATLNLIHLLFLFADLLANLCLLQRS